MPTAPARACPRPGCRHLRPCPEHGDGSETYRERLAARPWAALYKRQRWVRLSARVRREEPTCRACDVEGRPPRPSRHVDHIVPHRGDERLFFDRGNLQGLCGPCHSSKTRRGE